MDIDALIARGRAALDKVEPTDHSVTIDGQTVTLRFWPLRGGPWRDLTEAHPPRETSPRDQRMGYNLDAVVRDFPKVYLVDGDDVVSVTEPDPEKPGHRKWHDIYDVLDGPDMKDLSLVVWGIHEYEHQKRVVAAGKASAGGRKKKPS